MKNKIGSIVLVSSVLAVSVFAEVNNLAVAKQADKGVAQHKDQQITIPVRDGQGIEPLTSLEVEGVSFESINKKISAVKSKLAELSFTIDAKKKELIVKLDSDATKEDADFMERAEDLTLFKKKYTANMYAKTALARVFEEIKELNKMHADYVKEKDAKLNELKSEAYIPDGMKATSDAIYTLKMELKSLDEGKRNNVKKYMASLDLAKRILISDNELLVKESDLNTKTIFVKPVQQVKK